MMNVWSKEIFDYFIDFLLKFKNFFSSNRSIIHVKPYNITKKY